MISTYQGLSFKKIDFKTNLLGNISTLLIR